eukprot:4153547-Prymnesium_polylepis.1
MNGSGPTRVTVGCTRTSGVRPPANESGARATEDSIIGEIYRIVCCGCRPTNGCQGFSNKARHRHKPAIQRHFAKGHKSTMIALDEESSSWNKKKKKDFRRRRGRGYPRRMYEITRAMRRSSLRCTRTHDLA